MTRHTGMLIPNHLSLSNFKLEPEVTSSWHVTRDYGDRCEI